MKSENLKVTFTYALRNGYPFMLNISENVRQSHEIEWINKIITKFGNSLVGPIVYAIISNNGTEIEQVELFADGMLK